MFTCVFAGEERINIMHLIFTLSIGPLEGVTTVRDTSLRDGVIVHNSDTYRLCTTVTRIDCAQQ